MTDAIRREFEIAWARHEYQEALKNHKQLQEVLRAAAEDLVASRLKLQSLGGEP